MLECEPCDLQRQFHHQHLARRRSIEIRGVQDRPINLRIRRNEVPRLKPTPIEPPVCVIQIDGNWPSLEPWGCLPISPKLPTRYPPNFYYLIKKAVAGEFQITPKDIDSAQRHLHLIIPRHVAMYLCHQITNMSQNQIAIHTGGRDHTTARSAIIKMPRRLEADPILNKTVSDLRERLEQEITKWQCGG